MRDYLNLLRKHDFVICLSFLLVLGTALIVGIRLPKTYAASTLMLFIQPQSSPPISSTSLFQSVLSGGVDRGEMETIAQRFSTESMLKSAVENLENAEITGARYFPSIGRLKQNLQARIRPDTHYIELSVRLTEEEGGERNAALLTNQLVVDMQILRSGKDATEATQRLSLLNRKLEQFLQQVESSEQQALEFARQNGSPSTWYPVLANFLEQRAELLSQKEDIKRRLKAAKLELDYLNREIEKQPKYAKISETTGRDAIWVYRQEKLIDLEARRVGLAEQAGDNSPEIRRLDAEIAEIRNGLSKSPTEGQSVASSTHGVSTLYTYIQQQLLTVQASILQAEQGFQQIGPQLEAVETHLQQSLEKIPQNELALEKLRREIEARHDLMKEIAKQKLEAEILLAGFNTDFQSSYRRVQGGLEIIDAAVPRKIPVSPRLKFIAAIAGIVGGAIGISIALLMEYFGNTYRTAEDVESELELRYLGSVATSNTSDPPSQFPAEDYRTIAANINLSNPEINKQILMLTGCNSHGDVSTVSAHLAAAMTSVKDRVLIMDCHLSQPIQHQIFNMSLDSQAEELTDWHQAIQQTSVPNLDLLTSQLFLKDPIDFLRLPRLHTFFDQIRKSYEIILIDVPPILSAAESLALSTHSDAVILVVDLDSTTREELRSARARLANAQIPVLGFIDS